MHVVTGASGFVGSHVVDALLERGEQVVAAVRPGDDLRWLAGKPVRIAPIDVTTGEGLAEALRDATVIYHLAGATGCAPLSAFQAVNVEGTARVVAAARRIGPRLQRFIFVSSAMAGGPTLDGRPRVEGDTPAPVSPYGRSKLAAEAALADASDLPWVIVRPSAIYGPRDRSCLGLFRLAQLGVVPIIGARRATSFVDVSDVARGMLAAAAHPAAIHRTYHLTAPPVEHREIGQALGAALGVCTVDVLIPATLLRWVAEAMELHHRLTGAPAFLNRRKVTEMLDHGWSCSGERAARELGFRPNLDLTAGFAITAEAYRREGWIASRGAAASGRTLVAEAGHARGA